MCVCGERERQREREREREREERESLHCPDFCSCNFDETISVLGDW